MLDWVAGIIECRNGRCVEQQVRGGVGDSPGFDRRTHLERVISYGTPPVKWCRQLVLRDLEAERPAAGTGAA